MKEKQEMQTERAQKRRQRIVHWCVLLLKGFAGLVITLASLALCACVLLWGGLHTGLPESGTGAQSFRLALMDEYDRYMTNGISTALDGVLNIEKVYWLNDSDKVAPKPNPDNYGVTSDPAQMQAVLDAAQPLLKGQKTLFQPDVTLMENTQIHYYLDETILCITWRETIGTAAFTFSEVKIAHPSQFRRFLADGEYGSPRQYYCSQMAPSVNAVTASNADFYKYRSSGTVVYDGVLHRFSDNVDTCFIDDRGELLLVPRGTMGDRATAERFVQENNVRFSMSFGPILVEDSQVVHHSYYPLGQINDTYSRAGLGYLDELHYVLVVAGYGPRSRKMLTINQFADRMQSFGCQKAYALDGGQTGTIVTGNQLMNYPDYGGERAVSDIIYFASALPEGE